MLSFLFIDHRTMTMHHYLTVSCKLLINTLCPLSIINSVHCNTSVLTHLCPPLLRSHICLPECYSSVAVIPRGHYSLHKISVSFSPWLQWLGDGCSLFLFVTFNFVTLFLCSTSAPLPLFFTILSPQSLLRGLLWLASQWARRNVELQPCCPHLGHERCGPWACIEPSSLFKLKRNEMPITECLENRPQNRAEFGINPEPYPCSPRW